MVNHFRLGLFHLGSACSPPAEGGDWIETVLHQMLLKALNRSGMIEQPDFGKCKYFTHHCKLFSRLSWPLPSAMKTFRYLKKEKKMLLEHLTVKVNEITLDFSVTLEPPTRGNRYLPCVCWNVGRCCRASSAVWCNVCFCANERTAQCPSTSFWGPSFTNKQVFPKYVMTILCLLSNLPVSGFEAGSYSCVIIRTLL